LADWTREQVAAEFRRRGLPPHPLVAEGYASIGCATCTRPVGAHEDVRAGRWAHAVKVECGIHRPAGAAGSDRTAAAV
jgi:phosphoadenosine phosphosulfate reductase